jgi:hypothetical protein
LHVQQRPWINEFHYDNFGTDVNEFIEVAAPADLDISSFRVVLYNGFDARMYKEDAMQPLSDFTVGKTVNGVTFYTKFLPPANCTKGSDWCGLQNGRDGMALANYLTGTSGRVIEFISYEGSFTAKDGPAVNMTSTNIGVRQRTTTALGNSLSVSGIGCQPEFFAWKADNTAATPGTVNAEQTITCQVIFINEFLTTTGGGAGQQFIEIAANVPDISAYKVVLYSGQDGLPFDALVLDSFVVGTIDNGLTFYFYEFPAEAVPGLVDDNSTVITVIAPAMGMALVKNDDMVVEFLSYGGIITAQGGAAVNMTSIEITTSTSDAPVGSSVGLTGTGCAATNFLWTVAEPSTVDVSKNLEVGATRGAPNVNQDIICELRIPTLSPTTAAQEAAMEDDLVAQDDDFLDDNNFLDMAPIEAEVSKNFMVYTKGEGEARPVT